VVAGTFLSPRLYVQYVNDMATSETKLRLRYDLTKRLQIQTESGTSQGVDLFYTIER
jgi:translocation and assembly module TamB